MLMPMPVKAESNAGVLTIDGKFTVSASGPADPRLEAALTRFIARIARQTGLILAAKKPVTHAATLHVEIAGHGLSRTVLEYPALGEDESYTLSVSADGAVIKAPAVDGALRGLETFAQLIAPGPDGFRAPAMQIEDRPRFAWRGLMMDVSRHFMPVDVVERNLDAMAAVKLNVLHWHLSDDQGFRVESKRFPKLQKLGSDGLYYTQDQVREVIAYARDRGIRVVPEFDVPGHATSWLVGYPQLASAPGPYQIERNWGVFDPTMDPTRDSTYQFLDAFIGEMAALFPDRFFHIGGDEVTGKQWKSSARIRAFMRKEHLKDAEELQAYFNRRLQKVVAKYGKRMEGWDEILDPDLPKDVVIQSWRGQKSLAEAARHGFSGILSAGYYLDHMEPASTLYAVDPLDHDAANLSDEEKARILGGEVAMWGEFVSPENVDSRIWPRAAAVAERLWSPPDVKDVASMYRRLDAVKGEFAGPAGGALAEPLKTLADVVTPATFGQRIRLHKYTQQTPLNRLVDAAPPESETARHFASLVVDQRDRAQMRIWLTRWRDNDAQLKPLLEKSELLREDIPVSENLNRLAVIGLQALEYLDRGERPSDTWLAQQRAVLEKLKKPQAELRLAIAPSIERLVDATASLPESLSAPAPPKHD
jgi:hexosaminidase